MSYALDAAQARIKAQSSVTHDVVKKPSFLNRREISIFRTAAVHIVQAWNTFCAFISQIFGKVNSDADPKWFTRVNTDLYGQDERFQAAKESAVGRNAFLAPGTKLSSGPMITYLNSMIKNAGDNASVVLVPELCDTEVERNLSTIIEDAIDKAIQQDKKFISIPISDSGHIVHLLIELDPKNKKATIEFFDSFGHGAHNYSKFGTNIGRLIGDTIIPTLNSNGMIHLTQIENPVILQWDKHNCGIFVGEHFRERVINKAQPEDIAGKFAALDFEDLRTQRVSELKADEKKGKFLELHPFAIRENEYIPERNSTVVVMDDDDEWVGVESPDPKPVKRREDEDGLLILNEGDLIVVEEYRIQE